MTYTSGSAFLPPSTIVYQLSGLYDQLTYQCLSFDLRLKAEKNTYL